jgi:hypothetical protein
MAAFYFHLNYISKTQTRKVLVLGSTSLLMEEEQGGCGRPKLPMVLVAARHLLPRWARRARPLPHKHYRHSC